MLEHLRQRIRYVLQTTRSATLATYGPAGIEAGYFACEGHELQLYLLVPATSNHLFNLETNQDAVASTRHWQARGSARVLTLEEAPAGLALPLRPDAAGCRLVELTLRRVNIAQPGRWGYVETIDVRGEQ